MPLGAIWSLINYSMQVASEVASFQVSGQHPSSAVAALRSGQVQLFSSGVSDSRALECRHYLGNHHHACLSRTAEMHIQLQLCVTGRS